MRPLVKSPGPVVTTPHKLPGQGAKISSRAAARAAQPTLTRRLPACQACTA